MASELQERHETYLRAYAAARSGAQIVAIDTSLSDRYALSAANAIGASDGREGLTVKTAAELVAAIAALSA